MRWRAVAIVVVAMLAAFGIGVFIASRNHPFSPSVVGPTDGAAPTGSPTVPAGTRWRGTMTSRTSQAYREGTCTSNWRSSLDLAEYSGGTVSGNGNTSIVGKAQCYFQNVQVQTRSYRFQVRGKMTGPTLRLQLYDFEMSPQPSFDQGGFFLTIASAEPTLKVAVSGTTAHGDVALTRTVNALLSRSRNRIELHAKG